MSRRSSSKSEVIPPNAGTYHLHFGLGRLGLGLVLGLIRTETPLIVVQRDSKHWPSRRDRLNGTNCELNNNHDFQKEVRVLWTEGAAAEVEKFIAPNLSSATPESYLLIYKNLAEITWVTKYVSTITTALHEHQDEIIKWLESLDVSGFHIYPFENTITLQSRRHTVCKVVPDRICGEDITYSRKNEPAKCEINVEHYKDVVIEDPQNVVFRTFVKDGVSTIKSGELYNYYHRRKRYLVNAVHHVVAIFGYEKLDKMMVPREDWHMQHMPIIAEAILNDGSDVSFLLNVLIGAQAMRLVLEAYKLSPENRRTIFKGRNDEQQYLSLVEYGQKSISRFRITPDRITRVLRTDEFTKFQADYKEHVGGLRYYIDHHQSQINNFSARLKPWLGDISALLEAIDGANMRRIIKELTHKKKRSAKRLK
jgi:hypothetical protein